MVSGTGGTPAWNETSSEMLIAKRKQAMMSLAIKRKEKQQCFVALLFYVHGKHLRSCRDGQLT